MALKHFEWYWSISNGIEAFRMTLKHFEWHWSISNVTEAFRMTLKHFEWHWSISNDTEAFRMALKICHGQCCQDYTQLRIKNVKVRVWYMILSVISLHFVFYQNKARNLLPPKPGCMKGVILGDIPSRWQPREDLHRAGKLTPSSLSYLLGKRDAIISINMYAETTMSDWRWFFKAGS